MATFEELYHQHVQAVFRFALSVAGRREVAEDLTCEAFFALHRNLESIDQTQLPGWLLTVVRNRALSRSDVNGALVEGLNHDEPVLDPHAERRLYARIDGTLAQERDDERFKIWFRYALITPAIAVGVLAIWFVLYGPDRTMSQPIATLPVALAPSADAPPFRLSLSKPDVRLSAAALSRRGATNDNQLLADLEPALDAYRQNDYAVADRLLTSLERQYPNAVEVHFYQGISRLFLAEPALAIESFDAAEKVADDTFIADILWYRAIAEQHAGNNAEARARLESLCHGSRVPERSCAALEQLNAAVASRP
jgi:hypothetical protein